MFSMGVCLIPSFTCDRVSLIGLADLVIGIKWVYLYPLSIGQF
jgi:hypothetical protein